MTDRTFFNTLFNRTSKKTQIFKICIGSKPLSVIIRLKCLKTYLELKIYHLKTYLKLFNENAKIPRFLRIEITYRKALGKENS